MAIEFKFDGSMDDLKNQLRGARSDEKRLVKKSLPITGEALKLHGEMRKMVDQAKKLVDDLEAGHKKFWALVELGMDDFSTDKRVNLDTNEIEILADEDEKAEKGKPIPSPFQNKRK